MKNIDFNKLEILSPAGSPECFYADINAGANAVYLGLSEFNARMKAHNFTTQNIREFVKHAHKFGVKVYITVNTLLTNDDFEPFLEMVKHLVKSKVDAFIVQDLGVAHLLKNSFKNIILHASTQMGIHNLQCAQIAEKLGFSRIVLSREATLEDIKQIKQNTNLEIEYFVQGALCVAFSGNCYLSSLEKNASGNEGKCLQLCRLPYTNNLTQKTTYPLSARDLSLLENLENLIKAGVTSFKIEGRMRHAGYCATATKIYSDALKLIKSNSLTKEFLENSKHELRITYSRGKFNDNAYLEKSKNENIIFSDYQNHIGIKIGTVKKVEPFKNGLIKATLKLDTEISDGDGLKIIDSKTKTQVASLGIGNVETTQNGEYVIYTKSNFSIGLDVHLTQSSKNEEKILKNTKKIKINIKIKAFANKNLVVFAKTENDVTAEFVSDYILENATKSPVLKEEFETQFKKLSDTDFVIENICIETDNVFLPKSKINEARREIIKLIEDAIIAKNEEYINASFDEAAYSKLNTQKIISTPINIEIVNNLSFKPNSNVLYVYKPEIYLEQDISNAQAKLKNQFALYVPTILDACDMQHFKDILNNLPEKVTLYAGNIGAFMFATNGHKLIASPLANIKNKFAIKCLNNLGITTICASIETSDEFISTNNLINFESGNFPLMTFAHCPYKVSTNSTCDCCKYTGTLCYSNPNLNTYKISRTKLKNCQFELLLKLNRKKHTYFVKNLT